MFPIYIKSYANIIFSFEKNKLMNNKYYLKILSAKTCFTICAFSENAPI